MSRPIIIPIQTLLRIKLLTVVLVRLNIACTCKYPAERIVMARLFYRVVVVVLPILWTVLSFVPSAP